MAATLEGPIAKTGSRDEDGHRDWKIKFLVKVSDPLDGPAIVMNCPGLPQPGDFYLIDNDIDLWAWCRFNNDISQVYEDGDPCDYYHVNVLFSTRPPKFDGGGGTTPGGEGGGGDPGGGGGGCQGQQIDDPLLQQPRVSGGSTNYQEEARWDREQQWITNSAHEKLSGAIVEFDAGRPTVRIERNVPALNLTLLSSMLHTVNDDVVWGCPRRCVKFSNYTWERKYYGRCYGYYTVVMDFDINLKTFDREVLDEATKVLNGHWKLSGETGTGEASWIIDDIDGETPDPDNPEHFIQYIDRNGNPGKVVLNGAGVPARTVLGKIGRFISIRSGNIGNTLDDTEWWLPIASPSPTVWSFGLRRWKPGELVWVASQFNLDEVTITSGYWLYVAGPNGALADEEPGDLINWTLVSNEIISPSENNGIPVLDDAGIWDELTSYDVTEYVKNPRATNAGYIHVEKYDESNFNLLSLPPTL